jgi:RNA polymerase sigma-70 factor (ECF subfamily)
MRDDDEDLIMRIAAGNRAAFEALFRRYHPRLSRFVRRLTRSPELTEEIVNDAMLAVWQRAATFERRARPSTWLTGIAYNLTMKCLSRSRRDAAAVDLDSMELPDPLTVDHDIDRRRQDLRLRQGLARLPAAQRAIVELTYFHGYGYAEIAELVNCPIGTVKTRMFHARRVLRAYLGEAEPQSGLPTETERA